MFKKTQPLVFLILMAIGCKTITTQKIYGSIKKETLAKEQTKTKRSSKLSAKKIIDTQKKRQVIDHEIEEIKLEVHRSDKKPTVRTLKKIISQSKGIFYNLTVFTSPKNIKGTAVLIEKKKN